MGDYLIVSRGPASAASARADTLRSQAVAAGMTVSDLGDRAWLANADLEAELTELVQAYDTDRAGRGFASVERAVNALTRNASPKVVVDWLALQL